MIEVQYVAICNDCEARQWVEPAKDSPEPFADIEAQLEEKGWEIVYFHNAKFNGHFCPDCSDG